MRGLGAKRRGRRLLGRRRRRRSQGLLFLMAFASSCASVPPAVPTRRPSDDLFPTMTGAGASARRRDTRDRSSRAHRAGDLRRCGHRTTRPSHRAAPRRAAGGAARTSASSILATTSRDALRGADSLHGDIGIPSAHVPRNVRQLRVPGSERRAVCARRERPSVPVRSAVLHDGQCRAFDSRAIRVWSSERECRACTIHGSRRAKPRALFGERRSHDAG